MLWGSWFVGPRQSLRPAHQSQWQDQCGEAMLSGGNWLNFTVSNPSMKGREASHKGEAAKVRARDWIELASDPGAARTAKVTERGRANHQPPS